MPEYLDPRVMSNHVWKVTREPKLDELVAAHSLVYEHGALVFTEKRGDQWLIVNIYAPGTWQHVSLEEI